MRVHASRKSERRQVGPEFGPTAASYRCTLGQPDTFLAKVVGRAREINGHLSRTKMLLNIFHKEAEVRGGAAKHSISRRIPTGLPLKLCAV
jgi:hypothetical protein